MSTKAILLLFRQEWTYKQTARLKELIQELKQPLLLWLCHPQSYTHPQAVRLEEWLQRHAQKDTYRIIEALDYPPFDCRISVCRAIDELGPFSELHVFTLYREQRSLESVIERIFRGRITYYCYGSTSTTIEFFPLVRPIEELITEHRMCYPRMEKK